MLFHTKYIKQFYYNALLYNICMIVKSECIKLNYNFIINAFSCGGDATRTVTELDKERKRLEEISKKRPARYNLICFVESPSFTIQYICISPEQRESKTFIWSSLFTIQFSLYTSIMLLFIRLWYSVDPNKYSDYYSVIFFHFRPPFF